jgi:hypothetical protein
MQIMKAILFVYALSLPVIAILLVYCALRYKNYSFKYWISDLGSAKKGHIDEIFNILISLFGLLSLCLAVNIQQMIIFTNSNLLVLLFLYLTCISTILVGFAPMNVRRTMHSILNVTLYSGVIGTALFSIGPLFVSGLFPKSILFVNFLILLVSPVLIFSKIYEIKKLRFENNILSALFENKGLWEWLTFLLSVVWDFLLTVNILSLYL